MKIADAQGSAARLQTNDIQILLVKIFDATN